MMTALRIAVLVAGVSLLTGLENGALADHDDFRYKWPYAPGASFAVTGYPYADHHGCPAGPGMSCTDAWDIVIGGDDVRSSAEGTAYFVRDDVPANTCNQSDGYGNNVRVSVPNGPTVYYAHLASTPVVQGSHIHQGDDIGTQGHTGHTIGNTPYPCGTHLHFEFVGAGGHPSKIDGSSNPVSSTNSWVSGVSQPAQAIRAFYIYLGSLLNPDNSWLAMGWTADWTGNQGGCAPGSFCRLFVHYSPNPVVGHWGSVQVFRKHPGTSPVVDDNAIMVGRWAVNDAYLVQNPFFEAWLGGLQGVGIPLMNQVGNGGTLCPSTCTGYQRFSHGYIWSNGTSVQPPVFCPDVAATGSSTNDAGPYWPDHVVDLSNDILGTILAYDPGGQFTPSNPTAAWSRGRYDVNGDSFIDLANDILGVNLHHGETCHP